MESVLRINMSRLICRKESVPEVYQKTGGRGLSALILNSEVDAGCDPLGHLNKLVVAPGALAGTLAPSFGRLSFGAKSPLTKGIKEANVGGTAAQRLDRLGIKVIIVEGQPENAGLWIVKISKDGCELLPADDLSAMRNYDAVAALKKRFGDHVGVFSIGPAGEMKMAAATIAVTDQDGNPARHAARGGLGAVMGSKGLKAVVIDDSGVSKVAMKDVALFQKTVRKLVKVIKSDETGPLLLSTLGTPGFVPVTNQIGSMPTENYRMGSFESFETLAGDAIKEINTKRGGKMHGCMPGCVVRCSVAFHSKEGNYLTSGLEYETIAMLGANLKIGDVDAVAEMDRLCDELGVDTIEIGSALSQAMAAGKLQFGDAPGVIRAIKEIGQGTPFGVILGQGTVAVSKEFGIERIPAVLGQALPAHDPRACKTAGVTYATSPMGADHTAGMDYADPYGKEGQIQRSKELQIFLAAVDSLGYCMFAIPTVAPILSHFADLLNARYGTTLTEADIPLLGVNAIKNELEFNQKAGIDPTLIRMPDFVREEVIPPSNSVFDVPQDEINTIWNDIIK